MITNDRKKKEHLGDKFDINAYLDGDFDNFSKDQIDEDLKKLERFTTMQTRDRNMKRIQGLVSQVIPYFYIARGLADADTPRDLDYYKSMQKIRNLCSGIQNIPPSDDES